MKKAFTLAEVTLVMALLTLVYAMLLFVVQQVSQVSRRTTVAAARQLEVVKACEQLRWQLRCLFSQTDPHPGSSSLNSAKAGSAQGGMAIAAHQSAGMLGHAGSSLYGMRASEGRDVLLFITTHPKGRPGVVEVGYKLAEEHSGASDLLCRQFATRYVGGFHGMQEQTEGPWKVLLRGLRQFAADYSKDGSVWQREWDEADTPSRVRIHLETSVGEVIDFQVSPGIGAGRW